MTVAAGRTTHTVFIKISIRRKTIAEYVVSCFWCADKLRSAHGSVHKLRVQEAVLFGSLKWRVVPVVLALVAGLAVAWAPAPAVAASGSASVTAQTATVDKPSTGYCTSVVTKRCLKPLTVTITPSCFEGVGRAVIGYNNPNTTDAPVDVTITYSAGTFPSSRTVPSGTSSQTISGFPAGDAVQITVSWQSLIFANNPFTSCG